MVWQDYELIPTKRVISQRKFNRSIFATHMFNASGSWSTMYLGSLCSYAALLAARMEGTPLPARAVTRYFATLPAFAAGFVGGVYLFGDSTEFFHLLRNYGTYRKEFKMIKSELYYN